MENSILNKQQTGIITDTGDTLDISYHNIGNMDSVEIVVTQLTEDNIETIFQKVYTTTKDGWWAAINIPLNKGLLTAISISNYIGEAQSSEDVFIIKLWHGTPGPGILYNILATGSVSKHIPLIWPQKTAPHYAFLIPALYLQQIANPAAGANFLLNNNANIRIQFVCIKFTLTTDATVATRTVTIIIDDGTNTILQLSSATTLTASLSQTYTFVAGYPIRDTTTTVIEPMPLNFEIMRYHRLRSAITNLQAGDQISNVFIYQKRSLPSGQQAT